MGDVATQVEDFATRLKRRQVEGGLHRTARRTAELLRLVVSQQRMPAHHHAAALLDAVRAVGSRLTAANPSELVVGNVVRRVMHAIREEDAALHLAHTHDPAAAALRGAAGVGAERWGEEGEGEGEGRLGGGGGGAGASAASVAGSNRIALLAPSLHNLLDPALLPATPPSASSSAGTLPSSARSSDGASAPSVSAAATAAAAERRLKHVVIERINDLLEEIDNCQSQVADQALEHIHQNEVILTMGSSDTLLLFLLEAKKRRSFHVVVAEGAPCFSGHKLAASLAARGVAVTVIADAAVFALMARVNLVLVAAHAVMANGGVLAPIGLDMVALAARRHAVPFVVLAGIFAICPLYPQQAGLGNLNDMRSPAGVVDLAELAEWEGLAHLGAAVVAQGQGERGKEGGEAEVARRVAEVDVVNPSFDYIPPELVTLLVTDTGGHNPSYIYRLVAEYYSPHDHNL
ncbi:hypothetical protein CLOM_g21585 [Closterium sp. NIES-68]|nr:hypothetical protein CLOM_g21585 [Closterium sp. NIES-68]GJP71359.1 hypothetical protein CLOP_g2199 [Closterium sp. NIES-67]